MADPREQRRRIVEWIDAAIAANPRLSQAGLARHLNRSPTMVWHMLRRDRDIKVDEVVQISAYLGVPPPPGLFSAPIPGDGGQDPVQHTTFNVVRVHEVPIVGRVSMNEWITGTFEPVRHAKIPYIISELYAPEDQTGYEVDPRVSREWPQIQEYVVVVPSEKYRASGWRPGDYMIVEATIGPVKGWRIGRVDMAGTRLIDVSGKDISEKPFAVVIGSMTMFS